MKYLYPKQAARTIHKFGVDITIFDEQVASNNLVYEECEIGHLEEFIEHVSTHMWFVIEGEVTFVLNDEKVVANQGDVVVVPPDTRIHYFGKAKLLLCTTPAFDPKNEEHVRDVDPAESPYGAQS
jgi:mannose-6-phosphate isomerase-like protein (cupin superfamily)